MNSSEFFEMRARNLKQLYKELTVACSEYKNQNLMPFCMQWGCKFPTEENSGIIFYGRATNGWITFETDAEKLFDKNSEDCIFALDDQMIWVEDCAGAQKECYNSNKSAFWRVIRRTAANFYLRDELSHICWSNLCKIAPDGANPNDGLFYAQLPVARKIMQNELDIFSPRHVVLLTGQSWCHDFLFYLNGNNSPESFTSYEWGSRRQYRVKVYKIDETFFYVSEHPQGKEESSHVEALTIAISNNL